MSYAGAINLGERRTNFDTLVQGGRRVVDGIAKGLSRKLGTATQVEQLHAKVEAPEYVELAVIDFQRSLLKYLRTNGVDLNPGEETAAREQVPYITRLIVDIEKDPLMKAQVEVLKTQIEKFVSTSKLGIDDILTTIRNIRCPELINVHTIIGEVLLGAGLGAAGSIIKHIVFSPPPPPPPPPPPSTSCR